MSLKLLLEICFERTRAEGNLRLQTPQLTIPFRHLCRSRAVPFFTQRGVTCKTSWWTILRAPVESAPSSIQFTAFTVVSHRQEHYVGTSVPPVAENSIDSGWVFTKAAATAQVLCVDTLRGFRRCGRKNCSRGVPQNFFCAAHTYVPTYVRTHSLARSVLVLVL